MTIRDEMKSFRIVKVPPALSDADRETVAYHTEEISRIQENAQTLARRHIEAIARIESRYAPRLMFYPVFDPADENQNAP